MLHLQRKEIKHIIVKFPSNKMIKLWQQHHGWDEETTRRVYADAYSGKYQGTAKNKLLQAIQTQEMLDGKPPSWAGEAFRLPSGDGYDYGVRARIHRLNRNYQQHLNHNHHKNLKSIQNSRQLIFPLRLPLHHNKCLH